MTQTTAAADLLNVDPTRVVREMLVGYQITQILYATVRLGLPELMDDQPATADHLAERTGVQPATLALILDVLTHYGIARKADSSRFALTEIGETLLPNRPASVRYTVLATGKERYRSWGRFLETALTGRAAFEYMEGAPLHDFYAAHPAAAAHFNQAMDALTAHTLGAVLDSYDFAQHDVIVEVGSGLGTFMKAVLTRYPQLKGIAIDLPHVAAEARRSLPVDIQARLNYVGGDARITVPTGGDLYVIKTVLCDFPDDDALAILRACRTAIQPDGTLLIYDKVRQETSGGVSGRISMSALNLLVMTGGRERTPMELAEILSGAGFDLVEIKPTGGLEGEIHRVIARPCTR